MLTPGACDKALSIHNQILALTWNSTQGNSDAVAADSLLDTQTFQTLCFNKGGSKGADSVLDCSMNSPLELFSYNSAAWATRESLLEALNDRTAWDASLTGPGFVLDDVLGGVERDSDGAVTGTKVLALSYLLASDKELIEQQKDDVAAEGWEQAFLDIMAVCAVISPSCEVYVLAACDTVVG